MCPNDVALEIQQVVMVVETRESVQPQQGHAELSSHFFQFSSSDVKTLKRAGTCSLNTLSSSVERAEKNETLPQSNMHMIVTVSWQIKMNAQKKELLYNPAGALVSQKMLIKNRIHEEEFQL